MKPNMAERYVDKYMTHMLKEIATQYMLMSKDDMLQGEISFALDAVTEACGRMEIAGKKTYIVRHMHKHATTSLVIVTYKGNSKTKRVSRVTFNPAYKKKILEELINLTIELNPAYLRELDEAANNSIDIDVASLASYIEATRESLRSAPSQAYEDKLVHNLQIANQLLASVKHADGVAYVDEYWEEIDSGRINGFGISLQRIPKEVRHAALGRCHRYDFKAASYALMTSLALSIDPTIKVAALKDYIKNRASIRKRIAADVGISEEWMKSVFTSIGFGAELIDSPYKSIRAKLGQTSYDRLVVNLEFMQIKLNLDQVSKTIDKHFPSAGFDLCGTTYNPINPKDGKKRSRNQKLAWIYQCLESHALALFAHSIPSNYKKLLLVHDCIYLDKPLPAQHIADIKWKLDQAYPLLNFEHEAIIPIHAAKDHGMHERQLLLNEQVHRQQLAAEEERAKHWVPGADSIVTMSPIAAPAAAAETREQYEARRRNQFLLDVARAEDADGDEQQQDGYFSEPYFKGKA